MNTPPDKPPTLESVEAAQRFAASLPALPEPQEKQPTDYERGFADGYQVTRDAMEILETIRFHLRRNDHVTPPTGTACTNQIIDRIERFQAVLRKAASHV